MILLSHTIPSTSTYYLATFTFQALKKSILIVNVGHQARILVRICLTKKINIHLFPLN